MYIQQSIGNPQSIGNQQSTGHEPLTRALQWSSPFRRIRARLARGFCLSDWGFLAVTGDGDAEARERCGSVAPLLPEFTCRHPDGHAGRKSWS